MSTHRAVIYHRPAPTHSDPPTHTHKLTHIYYVQYLCLVDDPRGHTLSRNQLLVRTSGPFSVTHCAGSNLPAGASHSTRTRVPRCSQTHTHSHSQTHSHLVELDWFNCLFLCRWCILSITDQPLNRTSGPHSSITNCAASSNLGASADTGTCASRRPNCHGSDTICSVQEMSIYSSASCLQVYCTVVHPRVQQHPHPPCTHYTHVQLIPHNIHCAHVHTDYVSYIHSVH